jgi:hypothetical protein
LDERERDKLLEDFKIDYEEAVPGSIPDQDGMDVDREDAPPKSGEEHSSGES